MPSGLTRLRQGIASAALHLSIASRALATPVLTLFWTPPVLDSGSCQDCSISELLTDDGGMVADCNGKWGFMAGTEGKNMKGNASTRPKCHGFIFIILLLYLLYVFCYGMHVTQSC